MSDLKTMTNAQLESLAHLRGIDISECSTKADRIEKIEAYSGEGALVDLRVMGVDVAISEDAMDDFEVLGWLGDITRKGDPTVLPDLMKRLFRDDWQRIFDELKGSDYRLRTSKAVEFFTAIMEELNAKN
ncbi:hypothetical protein [Raoultibacter phocaeensis]|uniref:hypothetical protein n=1 Tax=Raoultibacter phocaeensis TaxID=2479841 RepID=UPI0011193BB1|nr:hypothetical protein [Raoultibacter phocaeensis]